MAASDRGDRHASGASTAEDTANALRLALLERLESVLAILFPDGKTRRGTFLIGDVLGSAGESLEVVLTGEKAGLWIDRAEGTGGDVFDLIAAHHRLDARSEFPRVLEEARRLLGRAPSSPLPKSKPQKRPATEPLGPATAQWEYRDIAGLLLAVVYRYDPPGGKKQFRPWDAMRRKWAAPVPRPLYHQAGIATADTVVLVEGESAPKR
jgi:putative DNA primase/helicase